MREVEKIEKLSGLLPEGKLDKALKLADVNDVEGLLKIGVLFGQKGVHDVAEILIMQRHGLIKAQHQEISGSMMKQSNATMRTGEFIDSGTGSQF